MRIAIFGFTKNAFILSKKLTEVFRQEEICHYAYEKFADVCKELPRCRLIKREELKDFVGAEFQKAELLIFISATGIAIRLIAPYIMDKFRDPAIICMDESGKYVIPLLSGHVGGANNFAKRISERIGANAVITTATDLRGIFAVDSWAKKNSLIIGDRELAKLISADMLDEKEVGFFSDYKVEGKLPTHLKRGEKRAVLPHNIWITHRRDWECGIEKRSGILRLIPRNICVGIGCRRNTAFEEMLNHFLSVMKKNNIDPMAISHIASIDIKKDEEAIIKLAKYLKAESVFFSREELLEAKGEFAESAFVRKTTGVGNVCERASALVYPKSLFTKHIEKGMTFAATYDESLIYRF